MGFDNECIVSMESLPGEYFCPVCRTLIYPTEALQAQCTHLYCKPCLAYTVATTQACPYDGYLVTESDSKALREVNKGLADAIGQVQVHCLYYRSSCPWQGSLAECLVHCNACAYGNSPVVCNRCGTQIVHRQVQDHAQVCPGVQSQESQAQAQAQAQAAPGGPGAQEQQYGAAAGAANQAGTGQWYQQQQQQQYYDPYAQPSHVQPQTQTQAAPPTQPVSGYNSYPPAQSYQPPPQHATPCQQQTPTVPPQQHAPPPPHSYAQTPPAQQAPPHPYYSHPPAPPAQQFQLGPPKPESNKAAAAAARKKESTPPPPYPGPPPPLYGQQIRPAMRSPPPSYPPPPSYAAPPPSYPGPPPPAGNGMAPSYPGPPPAQYPRPAIDPYSTRPPPFYPDYPPAYDNNHRPSFNGGSSFGKRNGAVVAAGWCRICKVDCRTAEGLDHHCQSNDHQRKSMDMLLGIKQHLSAKKTKLSSSAERNMSGGGSDLDVSPGK